jgi:hypothetical protein
LLRTGGTKPAGQIDQRLMRCFGPDGRLNPYPIRLTLIG